MQDLEIKQSYIGAEPVSSVNARDLYDALGLNKSQWKRWARTNIELNEFALETVDYIGFDIMSNGNKTTDYALTIPFAKKLAMQTKSVKGEEIRDYFLECERRAKGEVVKAIDYSDPQVLLGVLGALQGQVAEKDKIIEDYKPRIEAHERIAEADGSLCITDAAKALQMRPKDLFSYLRNHGWIYRRAGSGHDIGYQSKVAIGLLEHKVTTVLRPDGSERITEQVRVTPKGLSKLAQLVPSSLIAA